MATERDVTGAGGVRLRLLEDGAGGLPLLAVHGFTGAKEDFATMLPRLAAIGVHTAAFDHRGHGASDHPDSPGDYTLELLAADALAVADQLGWERFHLLGHSMGGMVAQLVALGAPERVTRLVLMDTGPRPVGRITDDWLDTVEAILRREGTAGLLARMSPDPDDPGGDTPADRRLRASDPSYREWCDRKLLGTSPVALVALGRAMRAQADRLPALAGLDLPTLVLVGEQDEPFLADSAAMASAIPGARLVVLPDAGHCPQFESPEAWWDAVSAFLTAPTAP